MNLNTTFLMDLHRERNGRASKGARPFLEAHPDTRFHVSVVTENQAYFSRVSGLKCVSYR